MCANIRSRRNEHETAAHPLEVNLNVKEIHARFCIEMCLNLSVLLVVPSGGAEGRKHLFLGRDRWQLVVECDRESSDVWLVVLLHGHACLRSGNETRKEEEESKRERIRFIIMLHASFRFQFTSNRIHFYSPRDNRRGSPLEPPLDVENAR